MILPLVFKILVLLSGCLFGVLAYFRTKEWIIFVMKLGYKKLYGFYGIMWGLPVISTFFFIGPLNFGLKLVKFIDQGWIEELGGRGIYKKIALGMPSLDH